MLNLCSVQIELPSNAGDTGKTTPKDLYIHLKDESLPSTQSDEALR